MFDEAFVKAMQEEIDLWRNIATMFYARHDNRRSCSLIASCEECDAYEKAQRGE